MRPIVHVAGARGVGSSTVAFALYTAVITEGRRVGYVDVSQLEFVRPAPDPATIRRNLTALWAGHRGAGATALLVAGRADVRLAGSTLCWLTAAPSVRRTRLDMRRRGVGPPIPGDDLRGRPPVDVAALLDVDPPPPDDADVLLDTSTLAVADCVHRLRSDLGL